MTVPSTLTCWMLQRRKKGPHFGARVLQYDSDKHVVTVRVMRMNEVAHDEKEGDDGAAGVEIVDWRDPVMAWARSYGAFSYADWHHRVLKTDPGDRFSVAEVEFDLRKP